MNEQINSPPLSARLSRQFDNIYNFLGLYFTSLLSVRVHRHFPYLFPLPRRHPSKVANIRSLSRAKLDPYAAAESSSFNTRGRPNVYQNQPRWNTGTSSRGPAEAGNNPHGAGGAGGGGGGGRSGGAPRRTMGIDDVRAPECGSCG